MIFLALPRVGFGFFLKNRGGLTLVGLLRRRAARRPRRDQERRHGRDARRDRPASSAAATRRRSTGAASRSITTSTASGAAARRPCRRASSTTSPRAGTERRADAVARLAGDGAPRARATACSQDIWLDPLDSDVLFGARAAARVRDRPDRAAAHAASGCVNDEMRARSRQHAALHGVVAARRAAARRAARATRRAARPTYASVPPARPTRSRRARARSPSRSPRATNNYDKAVAIERWLDANLTYTLELADPGAQEPIDFFLFDRKKGHCEYFASAFAVLARAVGIPTRQVNGFLGGEWNEYQGYVAVRAGDAHSWDEVFFPGKGWVTFDPTPPDRDDPLGRGGTGWRAKLGRFLDTLRFQWSKWVIEYDLGRAARAVQGHRPRAPARRGARARRDRRGARRSGRSLRSPARSRSSRSSPAPPARRDRDGRRRRATAAHALADRTGLRARRSRQLAKARPRAASRRRRRASSPTGWPATGAPAAAEVRELTELYYAAEWGGLRRSRGGAPRRRARGRDQDPHPRLAPVTCRTRHECQIGRMLSAIDPPVISTDRRRIVHGLSLAKDSADEAFLAAGLCSR